MKVISGEQHIHRKLIQEIIMHGDEAEILMLIDLMIEMRDTKDSDHALNDTTYQVHEKQTL